jgi:anti-anti-sigma regulatory factor
VLEDLQRRLKSQRNVSCLLIRMHQVNNFDATGVHVFEEILGQLRERGGGFYFSGVNARVFQVFKNSGLLGKSGRAVRSTTRSAIRRPCGVFAWAYVLHANLQCFMSAGLKLATGKSSARAGALSARGAQGLEQRT